MSFCLTYSKPSRPDKIKYSTRSKLISYFVISSSFREGKKCKKAFYNLHKILISCVNNGSELPLTVTITNIKSAEGRWFEECDYSAPYFADSDSFFFFLFVFYFVFIDITTNCPAAVCYSARLAHCTHK